MCTQLEACARSLPCTSRLTFSLTSPRLRCSTQGDGSSITVEPGLILGEVNKLLAAHAKKGGHPIQYKMGPDPSSIDSCMIGAPLAV